MLLKEIVAKVNAKNFGETQYTYDDIYPYFQEAIDGINSEISEPRHINDVPRVRADDPLFDFLAYTALSDMHIANYIVTYIVVAMDNAQLAVTSRTQTYAAQLNQFKKQLKADLYRFMPLTVGSNNYIDLQPNQRRPKQIPNVKAWYDENIGGLLPEGAEMPTLGVVCDNPYGVLIPYNRNERIKLGENVYQYVFVPRPYFLQWYDKCVVQVKITGYDAQDATVSTVVGYVLDLGFFTSKNDFYKAAYKVFHNVNDNLEVGTSTAPKEAISKVVGTVGTYTIPTNTTTNEPSDYYQLSNVTSYEVTLKNGNMLSNIVKYETGNDFYTLGAELVTVTYNDSTQQYSVSVSQLDFSQNSYQTAGLVINNNTITARGSEGIYLYNQNVSRYVSVLDSLIKIGSNSKYVRITDSENQYVNDSHEFTGSVSIHGYTNIYNDSSDANQTQRLHIGAVNSKISSPNGTNYIGINNNGIVLNSDSIKNGSGHIMATQPWTQSKLDEKVNKSDIDAAPTDGSQNPVSSDGVYDALQNVITIAEGKTKNYVIYLSNNNINNPNSDIAYIAYNDTLHCIGNVDVPCSRLKIGDIISLMETNYPDRWVYEINEPLNKIKLAPLEIKLDFDSTPASGSLNPVTSGGIYNFVVNAPFISQSDINTAYDESYIQLEATVSGNDINLTNAVIEVNPGDALSTEVAITINGNNITIGSDSTFATTDSIYL